MLRKWGYAVYIVLGVALQLSGVLSDLPIHCLHHQIVGQWKISLSEGSADANRYYNCGHSSPDDPMKPKPSKLMNVTESFTVDLLADGKAIINQINQRGVDQREGKWSMMYDEGFIINGFGLDIFTFFKFKEVEGSSTPRHTFDCTRTLKGWFRKLQSGVKGCMNATKANPNEEDMNLEASPEKEFNISQQVQGLDDFLFEEAASSALKISQVTLNLQPREQSSLESKLKEILYLSSPQLQQQQQLQQLSQEEVNEKNVNQLNSLNKQWSAGISEAQKDFSYEELVKKSGRLNKKSKEISVKFIEPPDEYFRHFSLTFVQDLPIAKSWVEYLDSPIQQDDCGSCYVIATALMLNARLRIKYGRDFDKKVSIQHILDCSFYSQVIQIQENFEMVIIINANQGCSGGYPFEVSRFGYDYFFLEEKAMPFTAKQSKCHHPRIEEVEEYFKVTSYGFIGERSGSGKERAMMIEIQRSGPIVVNIQTTSDLLYYKSGVYHSVKAADWIIKHSQTPEWRQVEHAVLCYGWGESEREGKYWLMQNSWGADWGDEGRFKMRRGTDESFVESNPEFANAEYITNIISTKEQGLPNSKKMNIK